MKSQNLCRDFEETLQTQATKSHPQLFGVACNAFPPVSVLKGSKTINNMTITKTNPIIHDYERILERNCQNIKPLRNSELSLQFLDHLSALGLSVGRVAKYATHLPVLLPLIDVELKALTKTDAEHIVAAINSRPNKASTKSDNKLLLRKLVQYAKEGSCAKGIPLPSEVSWISLAIKEKTRA
jgi:hypothetical protein